jgi:tRNA threonylcarbamoyladenosine biosynthesis protein TsaE
MSIFADRMTFRSDGEAFTRDLGRTLGSLLEGGEIVVLVGELGAGKTTFVKGLAEGLGVADPREVTSPTFLRIQQYDGRVPVHHVDAYRMSDAPEDFEALGGDELIESGGVTVIEWGEKLLRALPAEFLTLRFAHGEQEDERLVRVLPRGLRYAEIAVALVRETAIRHGEAPEGEEPADA